MLHSPIYNEDLPIPAFIDAVKNGDLDKAKKFIEQDARLADKNRDILNKALHMAVYHDHISIAEWLLSLGADADLITTDKYNKNYSIAQHLVKHRRLEMVAALLPFIQNINYTNAEGKTALHYAILNNDVEMCRLLINAKASYTISGKDSKHQPVSSQIGLILKSCNIEMAKILFARQPRALSEFIKSHPNVVSYVCTNSAIEHEARINMVEYLVTQCPEIFLTEGGVISEQHLTEICKLFETNNYPIKLIDLCKSRLRVNAFFNILAGDDATWVNKRITKAMETTDSSDAAILALDFISILNKNHPIMNRGFNQIFRELLAVFITPVNAKLNAQFGKLLFAVCGELSRSDMADSREATIIYQLTLLVLLQSIAYGKENVHREIVTLAGKLRPAIVNVVSTERLMGSELLNASIAQHAMEYKMLIQQLKTFYCEWLNIKLGEKQLNPCSGLESLVQDYYILSNESEIASLRLQLKKAQALQADFEQNQQALNTVIAERDSEISGLRMSSLTSNLQNSALRSRISELQEEMEESAARHSKSARSSRNGKAKAPAKARLPAKSKSKSPDREEVNDVEVVPASINSVVPKKRFKMFDREQDGQVSVPPQSTSSKSAKRK